MWTLLLSRGAEHAGAAEHRDELLAGLNGRVIEVGAGNGLNFRHYPAAVTEVVALEPEPYLRQRAEQATAAAPVPVTVVAGVADALPADDAVFDAGVASLVLCSVPEQPPLSTSCGGSSGREASCASTNTSSLATVRPPGCSGASIGWASGPASVPAVTWRATP